VVKNNFPDLPILPCLDQLTALLQSSHVILTAATGSGKTTIVPLALLASAWLQNKKILMLEPRRPAARMAATRMAALLNERVGQTVGYQVRFERQISRATRIEVLTEGLLLKRLQNDPTLEDVGVIIFDEYHERSLVADVSLALTLDVCQSLREDLRILIMSASLDSDQLAQLLDARILSAEGQLFPVNIHYATEDLPLKDSVAACVPLISQALNSVKGDVLVFLPGRYEINQLLAIAQQKWSAECEVLCLHGELNVTEQDSVLNPSQRNRRRLILSTDIAETSLTIDGLEAVVDSGRTRKPQFEPNSGLTRLQTRWISKASALQRSGRAGRLGPGQCYRAWTKALHQRMDDWIAAEILQADLAGTVLELAAWGVRDPGALSWLDHPPQAHWDQAAALLQQLSAIDSHGQITPAGQRMNQLPLHPRLAHMLILAKTDTEQQLAADIAAILSERDPLIRSADQPLAVDIHYRLMALQEWRESRKTNGCQAQQLKQLARLSQQFVSLLSASESPASSSLSVAAFLALAYPDRLARQRGQPGSYRLRNGRGVSLALQDHLANENFLVIANLDAGQREGKVWLASAIDETTIRQLFSEQIEQHRKIFWDDKLARVSARQITSLGDMQLHEKQVPITADDNVAEVLIAQIRKTGLQIFALNKAFEALRNRIQTLRTLANYTDWPDMSELSLLHHLQDWLLPWLDNLDSLKQLQQLNLQQALLTWLGWEKQQKLDQLMPLKFITPAGTTRTIEYTFNEKPVLRVPLQEMLGQSQTPTVAEGRLAVVLHLLSPAGRPLQVTQDLTAFWQGAYQDVKKEMRGRYPKHVWPDDPATAQATRFSKRRQS